MNIVFISHSNFRGNSAMHVFSIVSGLRRLGHDCIVLVPDRPETVHEHGVPDFPVMLYEDAIDGDRLIFSNGAGPDLIHAWSPREHVRRVTTALSRLTSAPYIIHMEDNEEKIVTDDISKLSYEVLSRLPTDLTQSMIGDYRAHPRLYPGFLAGAAGYSCLVDRLLEFAPPDVEQCVFWPGFDPEFATIAGRNDAKRRSLGIDDGELVLVYSGNVHASNVNDVERLYLGVLLAHRRGVRVRLVRTGWDYNTIPLADTPEMAALLIPLGFVPRSEIPDLLAMADMLVQPGEADMFNDYRFPSKLPEYLVSGRPVILPDSNIGLHLADGIDAIKLAHGSAEDIAAMIQRLAADAALGSRVGAAGRAFALERLTWEEAVAKLVNFYDRVLARSPVAPEASATEEESYPVKLVAFYLPQFHPIPENDAWWGKGFTEWANVVRAPRAFAAHDQPRLPTELGFYDLRVTETLHAQATLAREHGIGAFCFYYYWFNGRRLLERPLDLWLEQGPDFPFAICWANENWSRRWDGSEQELLIQNEPRPDDDERFLLDVLPILTDPRYLRVDGAPVLHVYKVSEFTDPVETAKTWRRVAAANGVPRLHLSCIQSFDINDPRPYGFDAAVEFTPRHIERQLIDPGALPGLDPHFCGYVEDYVGAALRSIAADPVDYVRYRCCFPRWDNSARRKLAGHVFVNDSPKAYANWLRFLVREALIRADRQSPLVYINAWNEWAEGAYLEPDERYGRTYLEITRAALREGIFNHALGVHDERERAFIQAVSRLPDAG